MVRRAFAGWTGLKRRAGGHALAGGIFFLLFLLGGMGGGDVKLMAAVGAWVGSSRWERSDRVGDRGRVLAVGYMLVHRQDARDLAEYVWNWSGITLTAGLQPHPVLNVQQAGTLRLPYGLAIAIGTFYCVGNVFWWR